MFTVEVVRYSRDLNINITVLVLIGHIMKTSLLGCVVTRQYTKFSNCLELICSI